MTAIIAIHGLRGYVNEVDATMRSYVEAIEPIVSILQKALGAKGFGVIESDAVIDSAENFYRDNIAGSTQKAGEWPIS
jgi:hypothetical protein